MTGPHLWLDRPWYKRGLLYHLYLVVLKDNRIRLQRAGRAMRVYGRVVWRWIVRYLTGRRWTVPLPSQETIMKARIAEFVRALTPEFYAKRRDGNRDLLTGMLVALTSGHSQYLTGWQRYKYAAQKKSNYKTMLATRIVGRPVIYQDRLKNKLGVTEWHQDFTPRSEQLAARKRLKQEKTA
jgi:hypothetical protein